mgnify:CR=1 FL=1
MKKILLAVLIMIVCSAYVLPPALPSSFWGTVSGIPAGGQIEISQNGIILANAQVRDYGGTLYYQVDVCNGIEGATLQFTYRGALVGTGVYHTGTNQRVDVAYLKPGVIRKAK